MRSPVHSEDIQRDVGTRLCGEASSQVVCLVNIGCHLATEVRQSPAQADEGEKRPYLSRGLRSEIRGQLFQAGQNIRWTETSRCRVALGHGGVAGGWVIPPPWKAQRRGLSWQHAGKNSSPS